jgi:hypothetical protein
MQMLVGDTKPDYVHVDMSLCVSPHARNVLHAVPLSANTYPFLIRAIICTWTWAPTPQSHSPTSWNLRVSPGYLACSGS